MSRVPFICRSSQLTLYRKAYYVLRHKVKRQASDSELEELALVFEARGLGVQVALLRNACGLPHRSQHRRTGGLELTHSADRRADEGESRTR